MSYLHDRGVRGFVTMNVLVFDEELQAAERQVRQMAAAGVDAVIVQVGGQRLGSLKYFFHLTPTTPAPGYICSNSIPV